MITVEGKTLQDIANETGLEINTIRHRWVSGDRTYERLSRKTPHQRNVERQVFNAYTSGRRLLDIVLEKDINISEMGRKTGLSRTTIYEFLYNGKDISSIRLMKLCAYCGVSMDYIMGLKKEA